MFPPQQSEPTIALGLNEAATQIPAAAETLIRRCYFHQDDGLREGFYFTLYLFGYGDDKEECRQRWAIALKLAENAMRQLSANSRMPGATR